MREYVMNEMEDKILCAKKTAFDIQKQKNVTRMEKHDRVKSVLLKLSSKEKAILTAECKRDLETNKFLSKVEEFAKSAITVLGVLATCIFSGVFLSMDVNENTFKNEFYALAFSLIVILLFIYIIFIIYNRSEARTRYILDILEENEEIMRTEYNEVRVYVKDFVKNDATYSMYGSVLANIVISCNDVSDNVLFTKKINPVAKDSANKIVNIKEAIESELEEIEVTNDFDINSLQMKIQKALKNADYKS